jgi:hypothetical protein
MKEKMKEWAKEIIRNITTKSVPAHQVISLDFE